MRSFFKGLFGGGGSDESSPRDLEHPRALAAGDIVKMSNHFGLPNALRDQEFRVLDVFTNQFEYEFETGFTLEGIARERVSLTIERTGAEEKLVFSRVISPETVGDLFSLDAFAEIFDSEAMVSLTARNPSLMPGWVADSYQQSIHRERGYFYPRDYRNGRPPSDAGEGEPFDYYELGDASGDFNVEIEVYESGETDVGLAVRVPLSAIEEMFPGS